MDFCIRCKVFHQLARLPPAWFLHCRHSICTHGVKPTEGSAACHFCCESLLHSREGGGRGGAAGSSSLPSSSWFPGLNCSRTCGSPPDGQLSPPLAGRGRERKQEGPPPPSVDWSDRGGTADLAEPARRNPVYSGNSDGLQRNRHFYLQGEGGESRSSSAPH